MNEKLESILRQKYSGQIKSLKNKQNALVNLLMGEVMKISHGRADPKKARGLIINEINKTNSK